MVICDFTQIEIDYFKEKCNFTDLETILQEIGARLPV